MSTYSTNVSKCLLGDADILIEAGSDVFESAAGDLIKVSGRDISLNAGGTLYLKDSSISAAVQPADAVQEKIISYRTYTGGMTSVLIGQYISVGEQEFQGTSADDYLDIDLRLDTDDNSGSGAINFLLLFQTSVDGGVYLTKEQLRVRIVGVTATPWSLPLTFRRIINIGTANYRTRFRINTVGNTGMVFDPQSSMTFKHFKSNVGIISSDSNWTGIVP
jgi:hypothetical protein